MSASVGSDVKSAGRFGSKTWTYYLIILIAIFLCQLAMGLKNGLNPFILKTFSQTVEGGVMMTVAYSTVAIGFSPILGRLSDIFGRKLMAAIGIFLAAFGLFLGAVAVDFWMIVAGYAFLGLSIGALLPAGTSFAQMEIPEKQRGRAMGLYPLFSTPGSAVGPLLGGLIADNFLGGAQTGGWQVAYGVAAAGMLVVGLIIVFLFPPNPADTRSKDKYIDWVGVVLLLLTSFCFFVGLNRGFVWGLSNWMTWALIIGFFVFGAGLMLYERPKKNGIISVDYMGTRAFIIPVIAMLGTFIVLGSSGYIASFLAYGMYHANATMASLPQFALVLPLAIISPFAGMICDKWGPKLSALVGIALVVIGLFMFAMIQPTTTFEVMLAGCIVQGIGSGLLFVPFIRIALHGVPLTQTQQAAGTFGMFKDCDTSMGTALYGTLFGTVSTAAMGPVLLSRLAELKAPQAVLDIVTTKGMGALADPSVQQALTGLNVNIQQLQGYVVQYAYAGAASYVYWIQFAVAVVCAVIAIAFLPNIAPKQKAVTSATPSEGKA